jgi:hypothetical protein
MLCELPYDILNIILSYIHTDERVQLFVTSKTWYDAAKRLNWTTKPTIASITSMSIIAYYGLYLTESLIAKIITSPHNYDLYANELRYKISNIDITKYGTVDDERYITKHKIQCVLNRNISLRINKELIGKTFSVTQLEDYVTYRTDIDTSAYVNYIRGPTITKTKVYDIINKCCEYDNLTVLQAIFNTVSYGQADAYRMLKYGSIKCLQHSTRNYTSWDGRTFKSANDVDIHPNVLDYVTTMWHLFDSWLGPAILIKSTSITYEQASRVDLSTLSNITACNPCVLPLVANKLNYDYMLQMALEGHIDPPTIKNTTIKYSSINELIIMIRNIDKYRDVLTPIDAPLLYNNGKDDKLPTTPKTPAIEKYSNDPVKFINYFNNRLKRKWSGNITHPDIYKAIVVQHWSAKCQYTGPITDPTLYTLNFHYDIGNPLIGLATIDQLKQSTRIPTQATLTIYEKESIIRYDRDDIVKTFNLTSLAYDNSAYTYLKYGACKIAYQLVDNDTNVMPDYNFDPILFNDSNKAAVKHFLTWRLYDLYFGTSPVFKIKEFKKLSTMHVPLLIRTKTMPYYSVDTPHLLKLLESMSTLSQLQGLDEYIRSFNPNKPLQLGPKLFNAVKHIYDPRLIEAIEAHREHL